MNSFPFLCRRQCTKEESISLQFCAGPRTSHTFQVRLSNHITYGWIKAWSAPYAFGMVLVPAHRMTKRSLKHSPRPAGENSNTKCSLARFHHIKLHKRKCQCYLMPAHKPLPICSAALHTEKSLPRYYTPPHRTATMGDLRRGGVWALFWSSDTLLPY